MQKSERATGLLELELMLRDIREEGLRDKDLVDGRDYRSHLHW